MAAPRPLPGVHLGRLAGEPARRVEVVDRHVHEEVAEVPGGRLGSALRCEPRSSVELAQLARIEGRP